MSPALCQSGPKWIKAHLRNRSALAPLTGQDWAALGAFLHLVELYGIGDAQGRKCAVLAMASCLSAMQPKVRALAKVGIPHVLDWDHEDEIWRCVNRHVLDVAQACEGDFLSQALNEGDGVYRP